MVTSAKASKLEAVIAIGAIELHAERRLVFKAGQTVHLTPKQFDLLDFSCVIQAGPCRTGGC
jgi:DNA-binding response OmpR family regulator